MRVACSLHVVSPSVLANAACHQNRLITSVKALTCTLERKSIGRKADFHISIFSLCNAGCRRGPVSACICAPHRCFLSCFLEGDGIWLRPPD